MKTDRVSTVRAMACLIYYAIVFWTMIYFVAWIIAGR